MNMQWRWEGKELRIRDGHYYHVATPTLLRLCALEMMRSGQVIGPDAPEVLKQAVVRMGSGRLIQAQAA